MLGRFLFRWRGVIGFVAFGVVFWLARPTFGSCLLGLPIILVGLATRFWASGYIGIEGRVQGIGARRRIVSGPYRLLRHPLYIGNFLLVLGMLVALRPAVWMGAVVMAGFIGEYMLIVAEEERDLSARRSQKLEARSRSAEVPRPGGGLTDKSEAKSQRPKGKTTDGEGRSEKLEARSESAEVHGKEGGGAEKSEAKGQKARGKTANGERRMAKGEQFGSARALCEWRTWVVTGVAWGLAMVRAAIR